jgi:hypothetical protein
LSRDGYLFKEVTVETYIETENIKPKLEELSLFKPQRKREEENRYDDGNDDEEETANLESQSLIKDIVEQLKDLGYSMIETFCF